MNAQHLMLGQQKPNAIRNIDKRNVPHHTQRVCKYGRYPHIALLDLPPHFLYESEVATKQWQKQTVGNLDTDNR